MVDLGNAMMVSDLLLGILPPSIQYHAAKGFELSFWTFALTVALEIWSIDTVKKLLKQKGGGSLYLAAVMANLRNHFLFGAPIYFTSVPYFCAMNNSSSIGDHVTSVTMILFVHSMCFYTAHRAFHVHKNLYKYHRFHHRFNVNVPPMAANAVSPVEYIFAYILPFVVAIFFIRPDTLSVRISVAIVAVTNVLLHTPKLASMSVRVVPEWWVATEDHLEHHRKLNTKYAAPTFNIDYLLELIAGEKFAKQ